MRSYCRDIDALGRTQREKGDFRTDYHKTGNRSLEDSVASNWRFIAIQIGGETYIWTFTVVQIGFFYLEFYGSKMGGEATSI